MVTRGGAMACTAPGAPALASGLTTRPQGRAEEEAVGLSLSGGWAHLAECRPPGNGMAVVGDSGGQLSY